LLPKKQNFIFDRQDEISFITFLRFYQKKQNFIFDRQDAVTNRALPLSCVVCNAKIFKVKNNPHKRAPPLNSWRQQGQGYPTDPAGSGSSRYYNGQMKNMPKSVSGYSLCASNEEEFQRNSSTNNGMPTSASSYSMASG
jgi:hypothetical protein